MTVSIEKYRDKPLTIFLIYLTSFVNVAILAIPFTYSTFERDSVTWHRNVWFFGAWVEYDRILETEDYAGAWWNLPDYSIAILIIILLAIIITYSGIYFTGKNKKQSFFKQRIGAIAVEIGAILGLIGTLFFWYYGQIQTYDLTLQYYIGFYIAIIYYPLLFVLNFYNIFVSNQIPKPEITPAPPQEGLLMDENKKRKKRRQFFKYIDEIDELKDLKT